MELTRKIYSLSDLSRSIRAVIERTYTSQYWIKAEIAKLNLYPRKGHCYPDLVEKTGDQIVAQMRATIWAGDYKTINKQFLEVTGRSLGEGMTILFQATISYHAVYGLSLQILAVEPAFTLGQMALEKQKTVERLVADGIYDLNKQKSMALLPRRVAVVSVDTSKGYHDWLQILSSYSNKYSIWHCLFPALLQGDKAVESITSQLRKIRSVAYLFDTVAIIRGGGGDIGLHCYDHFILAREVATFPIPVITGIGHATNLTTTEMVAWQNMVTPTDVAYFIIGRYQQYDSRTVAARTKLMRLANAKLEMEKQRIARTSGLVGSFAQHSIRTHSLGLQNFKSRLSTTIARYLRTQQKKLDHYREKINILNPDNILKRGFSITMYNGFAITDFQRIRPGDTITSRLRNGEIESTIQKITIQHEQ